MIESASAGALRSRPNAAKAPILRALGADAVAVTENAERARAEVLAFTDGEGVDHAVDYTGNPDLLRLIGTMMRLGGSLVVSSEQGREPLPFTAADNDADRQLTKPIGLVQLRDALARYRNGSVLVVSPDGDQVTLVPLRQAIEEHPEG